MQLTEQEDREITKQALAIVAKSAIGDMLDTFNDQSRDVAERTEAGLEMAGRAWTASELARMAGNTDDDIRSADRLL